jgi:hypothetical protein
VSGRLAARLAALAVLGLVTLAPAAPLRAQGCSMCKTALEGPDDPVAAAFRTTTLFLMATPYTITAAVGLWIVLGARRRSRVEPPDTREVPLQ